MENKNMQKDFLERLNIDKIEDSYYFPKYFEIETVNACNARCIMCTVNEWDGNNSVLMTDKLFDKYVEEVSAYKDWIEIICLNRDGEPTLDKKIAKKVKQLKDAGIKKVRFVTNAQNLDETLAKDVLTAGIDEIMFSIDSIKKETYEAIRIKLNFEKVINNTINYIKLRNKINPSSKVTIRMVEMPQNIDEKNDWLEYWNEKVLDHDSVYTMPMHNWGSQFGDIHKTKVDYYASRACTSPFSSMAIHSDGKVGICAADYNNKCLMGNFEHESIKNIWTNKRFQDVRSAHLNKKRNNYQICQGCDIWDRSYTYGTN